MTERPQSGPSSSSLSHDAATNNTANDVEEEVKKQEEESDPIAFLLAGFTRTILFAIKRIGLSPEVLRAFLQRKAFMRIATSHSSSANNSSTSTMGAGSATSTAASPRPSTSSSRIFKPQFVAQVLKSSVMGVAVFGVYELALARFASTFVFDGDRVASKDRVDDIPAQEDDVDLKAVVDGYLIAPTVHAGDHFPLLGHVGAGMTAGLVQSVLTDVYELVAYWWTHPNRSRRPIADSWRSDANIGLLARRAIRDSVGFAILFGTYECVRRSLERHWFGAVLNSQGTLETLERYRVVTRDVHAGLAYEASTLSVGAAFIAGGVAGQAHLVVNHYTHSLFGHHRHHTPEPSLSRQNGAAAMLRAVGSALPKPPKAKAVAGAFVPSALCFVAFRYGGALAERLLYDDDGTNGSTNRRRASDRSPT